MARIRTVKPQLRRSLTVAAWPFEVRYAWVLLWGYLDDEGRGLDNLQLITSDLFPLDRKVTEKVMDRWLDIMSGHVPGDPGEPPLCRFSIDGRNYIHATKWKGPDGHQRIAHPTDSALPPCPKHDLGWSDS